MRLKLDVTSQGFLEGMRDYVKSHPDCLGPQQVMVYVMAGGGFVGRLAAEQPADFYVDDRASRRPYPLGSLYQAVNVLQAMAEALGLNPHNLPAMPNIHASGIF